MTEVLPSGDDKGYEVPGLGPNCADCIFFTEDGRKCSGVEALHRAAQLKVTVDENSALAPWAALQLDKMGATDGTPKEGSDLDIVGRAVENCPGPDEVTFNTNKDEKIVPIIPPAFPRQYIFPGQSLERETSDTTTRLTNETEKPILAKILSPDIETPGADKYYIVFPAVQKTDTRLVNPSFYDGFTEKDFLTGSTVVDDDTAVKYAVLDEQRLGNDRSAREIKLLAADASGMAYNPKSWAEGKIAELQNVIEKRS